MSKSFPNCDGRNQWNESESQNQRCRHEALLSACQAGNRQVFLRPQQLHPLDHHRHGDCPCFVQIIVDRINPKFAKFIIPAIAFILAPSM